MPASQPAALRSPAPPGFADERSIYNDEQMFAEFVRDMPRTPEVYVRWRRHGIPLPWLIRAGFRAREGLHGPHNEPLP